MGNYQKLRMMPQAAPGRGVLVAEDESEIRELLEVALRKEGFTAWIAADGQEAVELHHEYGEFIDVALLDVHMPRLDGPGTLKALQAIRPQIPCCFMSGSLGTYTIQMLRDQGARAIVMKPFVLGELAQTLRYLVQTAAASAKTVTAVPMTLRHAVEMPHLTLRS